MDFSLNDPQKLTRDTVRKFMEAEVRPPVKQRDREERARQLRAELLERGEARGELGGRFARALHQRRRGLARRLLDDTDLPMTQIATASGVNSVRKMNRLMQ